MAKSIGNCYCLVFLPSIAQSFILEITLAYILQYYTGSPHIVRNSGRKFWLNFGSALAFEWSLKSHEAIYCSNPFEIFFVDVNNFFNPSWQSYLRFVYFRRMDNKNVTYRKFNSIKTYAGKLNGSFLLHITLLHFTMIFSDSKN